MRVLLLMAASNELGCRGIKRLCCYLLITTQPVQIRWHRIAVQTGLIKQSCEELRSGYERVYAGQAGDKTTCPDRAGRTVGNGCCDPRQLNFRLCTSGLRRDR